MKKIRKHWYLILMGLAIVGMIFWWRRPKSADYKVYTVTRQSLVVTLSSSGTIAADRKADLTFQTGGQLAWIGVKEGDRVRKWQGIANLDRRQIEKNLQKELNDYLTARWNFQDTRDTYNVTTDRLDAYTLSPAARRVLERSQFTLNNSVLDVEIQAVAKEFATVIAPFDGLVTNTPATVGTNVTSATSIAAVVDQNSLYFEAQVDELDIGKISVGQQVELLLDAYPDEPIKTTIAGIGFSPIALSGGGTGYRVKIGLPPQTGDLKYKLGMNGDAKIIIREIDRALTLPVEAVGQKDGKSFVTIKEKNTVKQVEITTGVENETDIQITGGLNEGERVIVSTPSR